jgi:hypothetical protein
MYLDLDDGILLMERKAIYVPVNGIPTDYDETYDEEKGCSSTYYTRGGEY